MGSYYDSTYGYAGNRIGAHMGMLIFAVILIIAAMIAALVMNILCCVGLAHAFGKGAGFACGLIFLNVIFILSLIHISEPTRQAEISYAVFCLKKKKKRSIPRWHS